MSLSYRKRAFTLIELLVVISIIALLVGILLPALGSARCAARSAASLSNQRGFGQSIQMYLADRKQYFPTTYQYRAANEYYSKDISNSNTTGYQQWSGMLAINGYTEKNTNAFVNPNHAVGGWAPTNFVLTTDTPTTTEGGTVIAAASQYSLGKAPSDQVSQTAGVVDTQATRLSYVPNEALMGRVKTQALQSGNLGLIRIDEVEKQSGTILLSEYTEYDNAIKGTSIGGGTAYKTHRPTNGVKQGASTVYNAESVATGNTTTDIRAVTFAEASSATTGFDSVNPNKPGATSNNDEHAHHIVYANEGHPSGAVNFAYADGHGAAAKIETTLEPTNFQWGLKMYSQKNRPTITSDGTTPVR